jgi:hypothetical protein
MTTEARKSRFRAVFAALSAIALVGSCGGPPDPAGRPAGAAGSGPRIVTQPTRTLSIPVQTYAPRSGEQPSPADPASLTIRLEAEDHQAEGPQSFDVLEDGGLAIADPLKNRLAIYSNAGVYQRAIEVGGSISNVRIEGGRLHVTSSTDGRERMIGLDGSPAPAPAGIQPQPQPQPQVALSPERSSGRIRWPGPLPAGAEGKPTGGPPEIAVQLERPDQQLASLRVIAGSPNAPTYVAAESIDRSAPSLATLGAIVRRYSAKGELEVEVRGIPLDYYVTPTSPFRVSNNVLYQLVPKENVVLVHVWDLR